MLLLALATLAAACGGGTANEPEGTGADAAADDASGDPVTLAVVLPLSGLFARQGELVRMGADMAVDEINAEGGLEALDGAPIELDVHDAGETVERAVSAATEALSGERPAGGIGSWLSSFTLAVTEVAERQGIPWVTLSFADTITERGFEYVYQTSAVSSVQASSGLQMLQQIVEDSGGAVEDIALVGDNTAASEAFFAPVREQLAAELGFEIVMDETWTPPLADASALAQQISRTEPDAIIYGATNFSDSSQVLQSNRQFGVSAPYVGSGAWLTTPEYVEGVGGENVEGILAIVGANPLAGQEELVERFTERTGEPFMIQDSLAGYYHVWLFKEAIELAGSADPEAVNQAMKEIDLTEGPAADTMPGNRVRFNEEGRRIDAIPVIAQWQDAVPVTIFPEDVAVAEPREF